MSETVFDTLRIALMDKFSTQVISHVGLIIAVVIGIATIYSSKEARSFFSGHKKWLAVLTSFLLTLLIYLSLRLVYWSWMDSVILTVTPEQANSVNAATQIYGIQMYLVVEFIKLQGTLSIYSLSSNFLYFGGYNLGLVSSFISFLVILPLTYIAIPPYSKPMGKYRKLKEFLTLQNRPSYSNLIADRNLQLAGFTLTAIALILVIYGNSIQEFAFLLTWLLVAMFVLFLGSFVAHLSENFIQVYFADLLQYIGVIILMASFSIFLADKLENQIIIVLPICLGIFFSIILIRGFLRLVKSYKQYRQKKPLDQWISENK